MEIERRVRLQINAILGWLVFSGQKQDKLITGDESPMNGAAVRKLVGYGSDVIREIATQYGLTQPQIEELLAKIEQEKQQFSLLTDELVQAIMAVVATFEETNETNPNLSEIVAAALSAVLAKRRGY